MEKNKTVNFVR